MKADVGHVTYGALGRCVQNGGRVVMETGQGGVLVRQGREGHRVGLEHRARGGPGYCHHACP